MKTDKDRTRPAPDFAGFIKQLEEEERWISEIHSRDKTGQAASDQADLRRLVEKVTRVGKRLGFLAVLVFAQACALDVNGTGIFPDGPSPRSHPVTVDGGEGGVDGAPETAPPSNDDAPPAVCHSPTSRGFGVIPTACKSITYQGDLSAAIVVYQETGVGDGDCTVKAAPPECSGCDYTCDCLLRYGGCGCSQETVGGPLLLACH